MSSYNVPYEDFFSFKLNSNFKNFFKKHNQQCEEPMSQLISKYNLSNSKMLSVGPKLGHEEYWFYKNDCNLTFIDMDEEKNLESYLKQINEKQSKKLLTYIIDDANNLQSYTTEKFDAVYFSSFTPNELRNWDVVSKRKLSFGKKIINRIGHQLNISSFNKKWPIDKEPFIPLTMKIIENSLKKGGLLIYQSHASGVDSRNPDYINLMKHQLSENGIILLHVFLFVDFPAVHLVVGYKGTKEDATRFLKTIKNNAEISTFHGRAKNNLGSKKGIKKIFDAKL